MTSTFRHILQRSLQWESPGFGSGSSHGGVPTERLQALATPMKGMEIALTLCPSFPLELISGPGFEKDLRNFANRISLRLMQLKHAWMHRDSSIVHESDNADAADDHKSVQNSPFRVPLIPTQKDLPSLFFLFCMNLLHAECINNTNSPGKTNPVMISSREIISPLVDSGKEEDQSSIMRRVLTQVVNECCIRRRLLIALRCSLTLGLSVLFGMLFSRGNGYWGGLVIASSMTPLREPTYRAANTRFQGTVLGTIYGLLGCYISQRLMEVRFIVLLPWFILSSFLKRSRMYGPAGGVSAAVAAILIMGRKDYGSPSDFATMRITETFISLACSIFVELLLLPTRASTLARFQLSESFGALHDCVAFPHQYIRKLKGQVHELGKLVDEATMEPNFWFLPFSAPSYGNLFVSLSKMTELLFFSSRAMEFLHQESQRSGLGWNEIHESIDGDLEHFRSLLTPSIKSLEDITRIKSLEELEADLQRKNGSKDIESGKGSKTAVVHKNLCPDEVEMEKIMASFLQHSGEILNHVAEGDEEVKTRMVLCLSALGYCMEGLMKEVGEVEKVIQELVQWENPSSHVNLYEISCKIRDLS